MHPQSGEYFISIETIFEFLIELIRTACNCNTAVEANQPKSQITNSHTIWCKGLMDNSGLTVMQEVEQQLNVTGCNVRICYYLLLWQ